MIDIDECSNGSHNCSDKCVNEIGSFHCECSPGELLSDDRASCKGKQFIVYWTSIFCLLTADRTSGTNVSDIKINMIDKYCKM